MEALFFISFFVYGYCFISSIFQAIEEKNDKQRRFGMLLIGALCLVGAIFSLYTIKDVTKDVITVEMKPQEYKAYESFKEHNEKDQKKTFIVDKKTYEAFKKNQSEESPKKEE